MKTCLCIALTFVLSYVAIGQAVPPDSVQRVINSLHPVGESGQDDTIRIKTLIAWAETLQDDNAAIQIFGQILTLSEAAEWEKGRMIANSKLGFYYGRRGQYYRACEYLFAGLYLAEKLKDAPFMGYTLRFLGDQYFTLHDYKKSINYYRQALPIILRTGNLSLYIVCQNNIGLIYYQQKQYDAAIKQFSYCLRENQKLGDKKINSYFLINMAASYRQKRLYLKALAYITEFRALHAADADDLAFADSQTARIYLMMNDLATSLRSAHAAYAKRDSVTGYTLMDINEVLYLIYKRLGQDQQALRHFEKLSAIRATNDQDMKQKQIDALRFTYENEKQKVNIIALNKNVDQKNFERNLLLIGLLFFACLGGLAIYNNKLLRTKNNQIKEQKDQISTVKEKLSVTNLQLTDLNNTLEGRVRFRTEELTQANEELIRKNREIQEAFYNGQSLERKRVASELHDNIGSTLSGLKWQLEALDGDNFNLQERRVYESVLLKMEEAYSEVRLISHNLLPAELETKGLSAALQKLIEDLNRSDRIQFRYETNYQSGTFDKKGEMELYSICLELVNNILKHAQATEAVIRLEQTMKATVLTITDNGVGLTEDLIHESKGMGLKNLQNRTRSLNGRLEVKPTIPHGTEMCVTILSESDMVI